MKIVGLNNIKKEIDVLINNTEICPHILLTGTQGCGKTLLARYIGERTKQRVIELSSATLKIQSLVTTLVNLRKGDIILIDEIHRLPAKLEEMLYLPLTDRQFVLQDTLGRTHSIALPKFTLIGATTMPSKVSKPLQTRFKINLDIPLYNLKELARIIQIHFNYSNREAINIALNTFTPREAIHLAERVNNLLNCNELQNSSVSGVLSFLGFKNGLSIKERQYIKKLYTLGKASKDTMSSLMQMEPEELKRIEDRLLHLGFIDIGTRGRGLTLTGLVFVRNERV